MSLLDALISHFNYLQCTLLFSALISHFLNVLTFSLDVPYFSFDCFPFLSHICAKSQTFHIFYPFLFQISVLQSMFIMHCSSYTLRHFFKGFGVFFCLVDTVDPFLLPQTKPFLLCRPKSFSPRVCRLLFSWSRSEGRTGSRCNSESSGTVTPHCLLHSFVMEGW